MGPTQLTYGTAIRTMLPFEAAIARTKDELEAEGFGVLCEIDVAKTMKEKLGVEFPPYTILGACNPSLAKQGLTAEPRLGLLLPCNVVVRTGESGTEISAIDAGAMMRIVGNGQLDPIAAEVSARLARVLQRLAA
ncbi:MAG: DUF302 domain-containing protein [Candidatus Velthaea sp.]